MSAIQIPKALVLTIAKTFWSHLFGKGPETKEWSLLFHIIVMVCKSWFTSSSYLPLPTFRKIHDTIMSSKAIGCQTIHKVVPNQFRMLSHKIVKKYSIKHFGSYFFEEEEKWEYSPDLEIQWIIPNSLVGSSNQKSFYYLHGGGFVFGHPSCYHFILGYIAKQSGCQVFTLNYRKAPEYCLPAIFEDMIAGYLYLTSDIKVGGLEINPDKIVAGGDSAGGCMVAQLIHFLRDSPLGQIAGAIMWSPVLDMTFSQPSFHKNIHSDILPDHPKQPIYINENYSMSSSLDVMCYKGSDAKTHQKMFKNGGSCAPVEVLQNHMYNPLGNRDLSNLPPILIMAGEAEFLRDDGYIYCKRVFESNLNKTPLNPNIPAQTLQIYEGMPHAFMILPLAPPRSASLKRTANFLKLCLDTDYQKSYQQTDVKSITNEINGNEQILSKDKFQAYRHKLDGKVEVFEPDYDIVQVPPLTETTAHL